MVSSINNTIRMKGRNILLTLVNEIIDEMLTVPHSTLLNIKHFGISYYNF